MTNETVVVASVSSRPEGDIVVGLLESEGIDAHLQADDADGVIGSLQLDGVRVMVAPADEARAREILANLPS